MHAGEQNRLDAERRRAALIADPARTAASWEAIGRQILGAAKAWRMSPYAARIVVDALHLPRAKPGRRLAEGCEYDAERVRRAWAECDGTLGDLAKRLGVGKSTAARWHGDAGCERGPRLARTVAAISIITDLAQTHVREVLVHHRPPTPIEARLLAPWIAEGVTIRPSSQDLRRAQHRARKRAEYVAERLRLSPDSPADRARIIDLDAKIARLDKSDAEQAVRVEVNE